MPVYELELELILSHMTQKPMLWGEVGARALRHRHPSLHSLRKLNIMLPAAAKDDARSGRACGPDLDLTPGPPVLGAGPT